VNPSRVVVRFRVRRSDHDQFHHVGYLTYIHWIEVSRRKYGRRAGLRLAIGRNGVGPILASLHCDYVREVKYPDTVYAGTRAVRVGHSSVTLSHEVYSLRQKVVVAKGESVVVMYNFRKKRAVPLPQAFVRSIRRMEGKRLVMG